MAAELLQQLIGVKFLISPYKGAPPAVNDLLVGSIQAMFDTTTGLPMVRQGRLRTLAIGSRTRSTLMPNIPTMAELGFPGFEISSWYILLAPARTPQPIIRRLNKLVNDTLNTPKYASSWPRSTPRRYRVLSRKRVTSFARSLPTGAILCAASATSPSLSSTYANTLQHPGRRIKSSQFPVFVQVSTMASAAPGNQEEESENGKDHRCTAVRASP